MLAPIPFFRDCWGDLVAVCLTRDFAGRWVVTSRFGEATTRRRYLRWRRATDAYDAAVDNAENLIRVIGNGVPDLREWPEDWRIEPS